MPCPWIRSVNPNDRFNMVCDLATLPEHQPALPIDGLKPHAFVFCGGRQANCENPNLLQAEMELQHERDRFGLEEDEGAAPGWLALVEEERYIREGR